MTRYLFSIPGLDKAFLLSARMNQDPLENYFGKQRSRGGRSDNPNVSQYLDSASSL